jgi:hypothetical protein
LEEKQEGNKVTMTNDAARERLRTVAGVIALARGELREIRRGLLPSPRERSHRDLDEDPSVSTEMRAVIECVIADCLEPAVRHLLDAAAYEPGPEAAARGGTSGSGLDLSTNDEETRKALYEMVVRDNFTPQGAEVPGFPSYTPEEAGLEVFFAHGRWLATWLKLEVPEDLPEAERRELVGLRAALEAPGRLIYLGV